MKKLRFVGKFGRKDYVTTMNANDVIEILKIKLNMTLYIAGNVGVHQKYKVCSTDVETTEHVFRCERITNIDKLTLHIFIQSSLREPLAYSAKLVEDENDQSQAKPV
jgi:hypothetical protein